MTAHAVTGKLNTADEARAVAQMTSSITDETAGSAFQSLYPFRDPVFVLCNGRSGSTLVRFLIDAHPDLACPPETNLPGLCAQLATVWSLIEGAPLSANRGDEPPEIPEAAIEGVRETLNRMIGSYLARRGKKRYCDKSLGSAHYAQLLSRVYPQARFICVYRHPMDVIASGIEACPWGLNGYGFDPYIAATPGNAVLALANFWTDNVRATLAAEESLPERSFRLRYEDLVLDPEGTAAALFEFLDVPMVPGISAACFSQEREKFGPADYKIWYTSGISADSIGRGWSVPTEMIAPPLLAAMNELAEKLGYLPVDDDWGTTAPPLDLRAVRPPTPLPARQAAEGPRRSERLAATLRAGLLSLGVEADGGPVPDTAQRLLVVVLTKDPGRPAEYWAVDLAQGTVTAAPPEAQEESDWDLIGALDAWEKVLDRQLNLSVALRSSQLRYCDSGEESPLLASTRIGLLGRLLGLADWR